MKIGIANDHAGVELKNIIVKHLEDKGFEVINFGIDVEERTDYPIYARKVAQAILDKKIDKGVLICGTGVGISIAANKIPNIRACVCSEPFTAKLTVQHNNANIIAFGARVVGPDMAKMIVDEFFAAKFEGDRHQDRLDLITEIEKDFK